MKKFVEKYKVHIGIFFIFMILSGTLILIYEKNELSKMFNNPTDKELCECDNEDVINKINELNTRLEALESGGAVAGVSDEASSDLININTATQEKLEELPGIGAKRAADIISYREANNGFKTTYEIQNIKGIGDSIYSQIESLITIGN